MINKTYVEQQNILNKCNYCIYAIGSACSTSSWIHNIPGINFGRQTEEININLTCTQDLYFFPNISMRTYLNKKFINYYNDNTNIERVSYDINWMILFCHIYRDLCFLEKYGIIKQYDFIKKFNYYNDWNLDINIENITTINELNICLKIIKNLI